MHAGKMCNTGESRQPRRLGGRPRMSYSGNITKAMGGRNHVRLAVDGENRCEVSTARMADRHS